MLDSQKSRMLQIPKPLQNKDKSGRTGSLTKYFTFFSNVEEVSYNDMAIPDVAKVDLTRTGLSPRAFCIQELIIKP